MTERLVVLSRPYVGASTVLLPALAITAVLLRRGRPWGFAIAGILLVKIATLGLAVLAMGLFQARAGDSPPATLLVIFALLAVAAVALCVRYLRSIGGTGDTSSPHLADAMARSTGEDGRG